MEADTSTTMAKESWRGSTNLRALSALIRLVHAGPLLILAVFWIAMAFLSPYFLTTVNISNMLLAGSIPAMLAVGQLLVVLTGEIDLAAGATFVLVAVVGVNFAQNITSNLFLLIPVMLASGAAVGAVSGLLVARFRIASSLVVTLGTLSLATGFVYVVSNGLTLRGVPDLIQKVGGGYWGRIPISAIVVVVLGVLVAVILRRTRWGLWVYAVGSNRDAALRAGIPVAAVGVSVFVLSGMAAGMAGIFHAGLTNAGSPAVSFTALIDAVTAVIIGGAALTGGRGTIWGTLVGAAILQTIHNGLNLLSINTNYEPIVLGTVLLLAVSLEKVRERLETALRLAAARKVGDI